jgi:hypothetical protein
MVEEHESGPSSRRTFLKRMAVFAFAVPVVSSFTLDAMASGGSDPHKVDDPERATGDGTPGTGAHGNVRVSSDLQGGASNPASEKPNILVGNQIVPNQFQGNQSYPNQFLGNQAVSQIAPNMYQPNQLFPNSGDPVPYFPTQNFPNQLAPNQLPGQLPGQYVSNSTI